MKKYTSVGMTLCLALAATFASCIDDQSTGAVRPISLISIDTTQLRQVYYIHKNEALVIEPSVAQSLEGEPLHYTWEIDQQPYSHEPVLRYVGQRLGTFQARLIVENADGRAFFPFRISVDSPYEEGIMLISQDNEGHSALHFMPRDPDDAYPGEFRDEECFSANNEGTPFASHVVDLRQCSGNLLVACQGSGTGASDDVPSIYYLNEKTLLVENTITAPEYPDFVPQQLCVPSVTTAGVVYPILCTDGEVYEFSTTEGAVIRSSKMTSAYAPATAISDLYSASNYKLYLWDTTVGDLSIILNGYGPYYCSTTYLCSKEACTGAANYFAGNDFLQMFVPSLTAEQRATVTPQLVVLTRNGAQTQKTIFAHSLWEYNIEDQRNYLRDGGGKKLAGLGGTPFTATTPYVASATYQSLLFAEGNRVRRWYYTTSALLTNAPTLATVGSSEAVITAMALSPDHKRTYVAFYEPSASGANGSVWEIDTDTGELLRQHNAVCHRPVKLIYKNK